MRPIKTKLPKSKDSIKQLIQTNKISVRNRDYKNSFNGRLKPDLKRTLTNVEEEEANWIILHGNNVKFHEKLKRKKQIFRRVVVLTVLMTIIALILLISVTGVLLFYVFKPSDFSVGSNSTITTNATKIG